MLIQKLKRTVFISEIVYLIEHLEITKAFQESIQAYADSFNSLISELKKLNSEFSRIYNRINMILITLRIKMTDAELNFLDEPPAQNSREVLNYFLTSTAPHLVNKLEYLHTNIELPQSSQQSLDNLSQSISENKISVQRALNHGKALECMFSQLFSKIYDWHDDVTEELCDLFNKTNLLQKNFSMKKEAELQLI